MIGANFDPLEENLPDDRMMREAYVPAGRSHQSGRMEEDELYHERFARLQAEREAGWARETRDRMQRDIDNKRELRLRAEAEIRRLQALLNNVGIDPLNPAAVAIPLKSMPQ